jgi:hypothetical protein
VLNGGIRSRCGRGSALDADSGEAPRMADDRRTTWVRSPGCCVVASTANGVVSAIRSDGGARTSARLHGCGRSGNELYDGELGTTRAGARRRARGVAAGGGVLRGLVPVTATDSE